MSATNSDNKPDHVINHDKYTFQFIIKTSDGDHLKNFSILVMNYYFIFFVDSTLYVKSVW